METKETSPDKRNKIKELYTNTLHRKPKTIGELWFQYEDYMDRKEKRRKEMGEGYLEKLIRENQ